MFLKDSISDVPGSGVVVVGRIVAFVVSSSLDDVPPTGSAGDKVYVVNDKVMIRMVFEIIYIILYSKL